LGSQSGQDAHPSLPLVRHRGGLWWSLFGGLGKRRLPYPFRWPRPTWPPHIWDDPSSVVALAGTYEFGQDVGDVLVPCRSCRAGILRRFNLGWGRGWH
jgi:hypothetical protein